MKLNYKELGHPTGSNPVIILHGFLGSLDNWITIGKKLEENGHWVFLVDQRNHGNSPHSTAFSYDLMASDLYKLIENIDCKKVNLIGHSMGGKTAMKFALNYPKQTESITIVDMSPKTYPVNFQYIFDLLLPIDISSKQSRKEVEAELIAAIPEFGFRQFLLKNLRREKQGFSWKANLSVLEKNLDQVGLGLDLDIKSHVNALFIHGGKSDYVGENEKKIINDLFINAQIITVPDAGHWVHAQYPSILMNHINTFLNG